jgi:hypothetical protein
MSNKQDFRVVHATGQGTSYAIDIANAKAIQAEHGGRIECYIYGVGWVTWCEAMKERKVAS